MTTGLLDRVLNGYKGADTSAMLIEELRAENNKLNARLSRMGANLSQNRLELDKLRRTAKRAKPTYSWLAERATLDAKGLFALQCTGVQPSRNQALAVLGMGPRRWSWARKLAMMAGIHDGALFNDGIELRDLIRQLAEAAPYAAKNPAAWRFFR